VSEPAELHVLAARFGFLAHRLLNLVEKRQVAPSEIRGGVALYDADEIRRLIDSVPPWKPIVRAR
jgi:hypothetical protein